jgi:hypothetical protein
MELEVLPFGGVGFHPPLTRARSQIGDPWGLCLQEMSSGPAAGFSLVSSPLQGASSADPL